MKTTVDISTPLLKRAKRVAAQHSTTLKSLIEAGLRHVLREYPPQQRFELRDARVQGRGLQEPFRDASWDAIRDAAYEDRGT